MKHNRNLITNNNLKLGFYTKPNINDKRLDLKKQFFSAKNCFKPYKKIQVHLVLHPHGIASTFLKLDSWSPGADFITIIYTKGINQIKKLNM